MPLSWFRSESGRWDIILPTWSYEWLMLNSTSLWEHASLTVSIRTGKSPLEKLLKLNSLDLSRLDLYCEEPTTYLWLIKHYSDCNICCPKHDVWIFFFFLIVFSGKNKNKNKKNRFGVRCIPKNILNNAVSSHTRCSFTSKVIRYEHLLIIYDLWY